jgi:hypothetical protein
VARLQAAAGGRAGRRARGVNRRMRSRWRGWSPTWRSLRAEGRALRVIADEMTAAGIPISHVGVRGALAAADRPQAVQP